MTLSDTGVEATSRADINILKWGDIPRLEGMERGQEQSKDVSLLPSQLMDAFFTAASPALNKRSQSPLSLSDM